MSADELSSGKGHHDENFPVASFLIAKPHRTPILSFYSFARAADDVADHPGAAPDEKLRLLDEMDRTLMGERDTDAHARRLRLALDGRKLSPQHALLLLEAFRRDVTKLRYADWGELMDYCRYSAMPVGRFVLDVHGEARSTWPASDALCAALQVINHLQDCAKDYRALDRVYLPLDTIARFGASVEMLAEPRAPGQLRAVIAALAQETSKLLDRSRIFASQIRDRRLALEVSLIQTLAEDLNGRLMRRDPLSERVHHRKMEIVPLAVTALYRFLGRKSRNKSPQSKLTPQT